MAMLRDVYKIAFKYRAHMVPIKCMLRKNTVETGLGERLKESMIKTARKKIQPCRLPLLHSARVTGKAFCPCTCIENR